MWSVPEHTRKNTGEYWSDIKPRRGRVTENKILSRRAAKVTKSDQNLKENVVTLIVFKLMMHESAVCEMKQSEADVSF